MKNRKIWKICVDKNSPLNFKAGVNKKGSLVDKPRRILHKGGFIVLKLVKFLKKDESSISVEELEEIKSFLSRKGLVVLTGWDADVFLENQQYIPKDWKRRIYYRLLFGGSANKCGPDGCTEHAVRYIWYHPDDREWKDYRPSLEIYDFWDFERDRLVCAVKPK